MQKHEVISLFDILLIPQVFQVLISENLVARVSEIVKSTFDLCIIQTLSWGLKIIFILVVVFLTLEDWILLSI